MAASPNLLPWFETARCARLLTMRPCGHLWSAMNQVCVAIEPISAHSRESGNPGAENSARELGPRVRGDERNQEAIQAQLISL